MVSMILTLSSLRRIVVPGKYSVCAQAPPPTESSIAAATTNRFRADIRRRKLHEPFQKANTRLSAGFHRAFLTVRRIRSRRRARLASDPGPRSRSFLGLEPPARSAILAPLARL